MDVIGKLYRLNDKLDAFTEEYRTFLPKADQPRPPAYSNVTRKGLSSA